MPPDDIINPVTPLLPTGGLVGGLVGVVLFVVMAVIRGWLIPRSLYRDRMADKDQQIQDWRETAQLERTRGDIFADNQRQLLEAATTTNQILQNLEVMRGGG